MNKSMNLLLIVCISMLLGFGALVHCSADNKAQSETMYSDSKTFEINAFSESPFTLVLNEKWTINTHYIKDGFATFYYNCPVHPGDTITIDLSNIDGNRIQCDLMLYDDNQSIAMSTQLAWYNKRIQVIILPYFESFDIQTFRL